MGAWDDWLSESDADAREDELWQAFVWRLEREEEQGVGHVWTVSEVNECVRRLLNASGVLDGIWVRGEISRWQEWRSGHVYFTLRDENSQIDGVMWRERVRQLTAPPQVGEWVRVFGSVRVPRKGGRFELDAVTLVREVDKGFWWQRLEETKRRLHAEGLFDERRKRPLPAFPERIGIVTSLDAAALRDMVRIVRERHAGVEIVVFHAIVQGEEAPASLARAIQLANSAEVERLVGKLDVLIVGRGGGSIEDLWAFNEEVVVRAVAESRIPTVSAVGHEVDFVLTDFAADWRAPTPTAAAQRVVPDRRDLLRHLQQLDTRLQRAAAQRLHHLRERLRRLSERRCFADPLSLLGDFRQSLDNAAMRLEAGAQQRLADCRRRLLELAHRLAWCSPQAQLERWRERLARYAERLQAASTAHVERRRRALAALAGKLEALNPYAVLQRGYALVRDPQTKRVLTRATHLVAGQAAEVVMADGTAHITVNEVVRSHGTPAP